MITDTLFPVIEVPAVGIPNKVNSKEIDSTGYKFIVREDTGDVLSCMTNEYRMVKNKEIIDIAAPILKQHDAELIEAITLVGWTFIALVVLAVITILVGEHLDD